jgi:hypothetical protein
MYPPGFVDLVQSDENRKLVRLVATLERTHAEIRQFLAEVENPNALAEQGDDLKARLEALAFIVGEHANLIDSFTIPTPADLKAWQRDDAKREAARKRRGNKAAQPVS